MTSKEEIIAKELMAELMIANQQTSLFELKFRMCKSFLKMWNYLYLIRTNFSAYQFSWISAPKATIALTLILKLRGNGVCAKINTRKI